MAQFDEGELLSLISALAGAIREVRDAIKNQDATVKALAGAPVTAAYVVAELNSTLSGERLLTGTANQIKVTDGGANGAVTLSIPDPMLLSGNVIIGSSSVTPDGTLHVHTGSAGAVTAVSGADDLVVENSTHAGISILSDTGDCLIALGDTEDADVGKVFYDHTNNRLELWARGAVLVRLTDTVDIPVQVHVNSEGTGTDTDLEVSDGATQGAGAIHRASSGTHSMPHMKTILRRYTAVDELQAYNDIKSLRPFRFRYRRGADAHDPSKPGVDDPTMPEHNGYSFLEVPDFIKDPNTETITIDDRIMMCEMALKEVIRKVELP